MTDEQEALADIRFRARVLVDRMHHIRHVARRGRRLMTDRERCRFLQASAELDQLHARARDIREAN